MRLVVLLAAAAVLAGPASAVAALHTGRPYADRFARRFAVPLPPGPITLSAAPCPGTQARDGVICTDTDRGVVYFPYRGRISRFTFAHELGHVFDARVLSDVDRQRFAGLLGGAGREWATATGDACLSVACPSERFADAYANCAVGGVPGVHRVRSGRRRGRLAWDWQSPYGYDPSKRRHRRVCREIRRLA